MNKVLKKNKQQGFIQTTKDYSIFEYIDYNRAIESVRVKRIEKSIREHGFLLPILVNQDMKVIDGQHRLCAAEMANSIVDYIQIHIAEDKLPYLIAHVNSTAKNWSLEDHFNLWFKQKVPAYVEMKKFMGLHGFNFTDFMAVMNLKGSPAFKNGVYDFNAEKKKMAKDRMSQVNEIINEELIHTKVREHAPFKKAVIRVVRHPEYNHIRMMKKLNELSDISKNTNSAGYVERLETIYNFHVSKNVVKFSRTQN